MNKNVVLLTGCSSGFGFEMVQAFLRLGWIVIATMRSLSEREHIFEKELKNFPYQLYLKNLDVTNQDECCVVSAAIEKEIGTLSCIVNNAGYGLLGALEDISQNQIEKQMSVNFFGSVNVIRACLPLLRKSKGKIINISSLFGFSPFPLSSVYCAGKYALEGLSESLYYELKPLQVQVALVQPAAYKTKFGENCEWGINSFDSKSPYYKQSLNLKNFKENLARKNKELSASVAKKVCRIANSNSIKLHNRVDANTKVVYLLKKILPSFISTHIFSLIFNKIFISKSNEGTA